MGKRALSDVPLRHSRFAHFVRYRETASSVRPMAATTRGPGGVRIPGRECARHRAGELAPVVGQAHARRPSHLPAHRRRSTPEIAGGCPVDKLPVLTRPPKLYENYLS